MMVIDKECHQPLATRLVDLVETGEQRAVEVEHAQDLAGHSREGGEVSGVLDLDSPLIARFDEIDQAGCEQLVALFVDHHHGYSG